MLFGFVAQAHAMSLAVDKVISNYRRTTLTTGKLILELAQALERLDDGQREHYRLLSKALLSCYVNDGQRAAVIIGREQDSSATLIAVNADNDQITEMLAQMSELMGAGVVDGRQYQMAFN